MIEKLHWGIAGCGNVSGDFAKALSYTLYDHILSAVAARDLEKAEEFVRKNELGNVTAYGSYSELFRADSVDIVYIGVLNHCHKPLVLEALDNGKHVVCEKPLGLNVAETREMIEAARNRGLFLMEGYWTCFFPAFKEFHLKLKHIESVNVVLSECGYAHHAPNKLEKSLGGGDLMATGCYNIMAVLSILGSKNIKKITATGGKNDSGVDVWTTTLIEYDDNRTASLFNTALATTPSSLVASGTNGFVKIPRTLWCPSEVISNIDGKLDEASFDFNNPKDGKDRQFRYPKAMGFSYEQDHVFKCLKKGLKESSRVSHETSLEIANVLQEIRHQIGVRYDNE